jgi:opacity protein-like surface antigen
VGEEGSVTIYSSALSRLLALAVLLFVPCTGAMADDDESGGVGFYLGTGAVRSFEDFDHDRIDFDDAVGLDFRAGFRFEEWIALEVQSEWSGRFDGDTRSSDLEIHYRGLNTKLYPLQTWIDPFVVVGAGVLYGRLDREGGNKNDFGAAFRIGGGVEIPILERVRLTVEGSYVAPTPDLEEYRYAALSTGFVWHFFVP